MQSILQERKYLKTNIPTEKNTTNVFDSMMGVAKETENNGCNQNIPLNLLNVDLNTPS